MMKKLIVILFISCFAFVSCNNSNSNFNSNVPAEPASENVEGIYQKILYIIGSSFNDARCIVGSTSGFCKMYLGSQQGAAQPFFANVAYAVFIPIQGYSQAQNEDGTLSNFQFGGSDLFNTKSINADWTPKDSGSGKFLIKLIKNSAGEVVLLISIKGSSWEYYDNVILNDKMLKRIVELLGGDTAQIPVVADTAQTNVGMDTLNAESEVGFQDESFYVIPISISNNFEASSQMVEDMKQNDEMVDILNLEDYQSFDKNVGYMVYYGPFSNQNDCVNFLKGLTVSKKGVYGLLASQESKRVQVSPNGTVTERILE